MNIVEKTMDAYEIADNLYNDAIVNPNDIVTIENCDLKTYFEMLLIIFMEGLYKFCRYSINENNKFNLNVIESNDILKINSYFKKIKIKLNFTMFEISDWHTNHIHKYTTYDKLIIHSKTNLNDLYTIFYVDYNVYLVYFDHV
tara:strand:- start:114 stop:542 length:429 start_codon:yes stop_codon:yes gene_type:complete